MNGLKLERIGLIMQPEPGNPMEAGGVLNPAAVRGPDGELYLFPRVVAAGNYSRIGIARVVFDGAGDPARVERLGIALQPEADYELRSDGGGGCEDPRITFVEPLRCYVMAYTAHTPDGPRIALAVSHDLFAWQRLGVARFAPFNGVHFDGVDNKDACVFPTAIPNPDGVPAVALLHRPLFPGTRPEEKARRGSGTRDLHRESIWISYCTAAAVPGADPSRLRDFTSHHRLAAPHATWEALKIGAGPPPVLTRYGWLMIYHGVQNLRPQNGHHLCYSAGMMVLSADHPHQIRYRSAEPVLTPTLPQERDGAIANVVFPTGIDRRDDLGAPDRFDVYYGMADDVIGVARLDLPDGSRRQPQLSDG